MKKILVIPAVIGLIAVPSVAFAQHGADDNNPNDVRREDRQQDRRNDNAAQPATPATPNAQGAEQENELNDDNDNDNNNQIPVDPNAVAVTQDQALAIAMTTMPGKTVKKIQSESEHGSPVFSVRFTDGSRVDVRVSDGAVIRTKTKTDKNMVNSNSQSQSGRHGDDDDDNGDNSNRGGHGNNND